MRRLSLDVTVTVAALLVVGFPTYESGMLSARASNDVPVASTAGAKSSYQMSASARLRWRRGQEPPPLRSVFARGSILRPVNRAANVPIRTGGRLSHPCASSYGDYSSVEYYDPELDCIEELSSWDLASIINSVQQWEGQCSDHANWLYLHSLYEWTGNYNSGYEWNAFTDGYIVAMQWPYFEDYYLWAHEASHGLGYWDEPSAIWWGQYCTQYLYPPSPTPSDIDSVVRQ
jgi:hypothetical protein